MNKKESTSNGVRFSQSLIWKLQRAYYEQEGISAWRTGEVPHYLSSNPMVGKTYAELVLAFLRDRALMGHSEEPVYILELGAGHGRLCYHFFKHLERFYAESAIALPPICYVLSDIASSNIDFWKSHPRLLPYLQKGWLDFAHFDAETGTELRLTHSGTVITTGALEQPLIVMGNYFFDTIPQDLFLIEDERLYHALLRLTTITDADPATLSTADIIEALQLEYSYEQVEGAPYPDDPILASLMEAYMTGLKDTHVMIPHIGIRCLDRLQRLSKQGAMLLSLDKGDHHFSQLENRDAPLLSAHGSFSLSVNYHALQAYCEAKNGLPLFSPHQHSNLDLGCLLFVNNAETYVETRQAYDRFVNDYGPDDYFSLKKLIETHYDSLSFRDMFGTLRLSGYDAHLFFQMLPRLFVLAPEMTENERWSLFQAVPRIWDYYYPLGEPNDLAQELGTLLFALGFYAEAIIYYDLSQRIYGPQWSASFSIARCHCRLNNAKQARPMIEKLHLERPDSEDIAVLRQELEQASRAS